MSAPRVILPLIFAGVFILVRGATGQTTQPEMMKQVVKANNMFRFAFYERLATTTGAPAKNLLFSPYSISTAFSMLLDGARGETARQLRAVLQIGDVNGSPAMTRSEEISDGIQSLQTQLTGSTADASFQLFPAEGVWIDQGFSVLPDYAATLRQVYGTRNPITIDFKNGEQAQQTINAWGDQKTKGKIKQIIHIDPSSRTTMVLASTMYLKAAWFKPFARKDTSDKPFHIDQNSAHDVVVPTMSQVLDDNPYFENDDFQMVMLMYGHWLETENSLKPIVPAYMVLVLPKRRDSLPAIEKSLTWEKLDRCTSDFGNATVHIELPKFEFNTALDLKPVVGELGAGAIFNPDKADLSGIARSTSGPLYAASATHYAAIDVNEEGTEAAAASTVEMALGGAPEKITEFTADHPFLFYIIHRQTNAVLFMGRVMNPRG